MLHLHDLEEQTGVLHLICERMMDQWLSFCNGGKGLHLGC
jgi:hypothetical protein